MTRAITSLWLSISLLGLTVVVRGEMSPTLKALVDAERAFAKVSVEKSTRDAFLEYLADDSLLFRPGPVPGKMFTRNRPAPPGKLAWAPVFADVASSGDIGYTTGPWEFRKAEMTEAPSGYGQYVSLWRLQKDGQWKVEVDLGISHEKFTTAVADVKEVETPTVPPPATGSSSTAAKPAESKAAEAKAANAKAAEAKSAGAKSAEAATAAAERPANAPASPPSTTSVGATPSATAAPAKPGATPGAPPSPTAGAPTNAPLTPTKAAEEALKEVDRTFAAAATKDGIVKAFQATSSDRVRVLRNGNFPAIGKAAIEKLPVSDLGTTWQPTHARVAASGDLGYTTGMISLGSGGMPGAPATPHYYVRIWRKDAAGTWKIQLDIVN
jgi:ketosteroid isomerase-like protein